MLQKEKKQTNYIIQDYRIESSSQHTKTPASTNVCSEGGEEGII